MRTMLDFARQYSSRWRIFPCHWPIIKGDQVICSCGKPPGKGKGFCSSPGKHPRTPHGFYDASADERQITEWWTRTPHANIGLVTGIDNDLLVLDVDPPHGGDKTLAELEAKHGQLPDTMRANTGSGGQHIIFKHVDGLTNCVGAIGDGLDIRTQGGYIVVAPSLHPSGKRYEWANALQAVDAPQWLIEEIKKRGGAAPENGGRGGQHDYWLRVAKGIRQGERHVVILKLAGLLVGSRRLPAGLGLSLLRAFNATYCQPPLPEEEVDERYDRVMKRQLRIEIETKQNR